MKWQTIVSHVQIAAVGTTTPIQTKLAGGSWTRGGSWT